MTDTKKLTPGQRVLVKDPHNDKAGVTGKVRKIDEGKNQVEVETADGRVLEVEPKHCEAWGGTTDEVLNVGQRVRFKRSHDKAVELVGTIVKVNEDSTVEILTEVDGKVIEVETTETAHIADVAPVGKADHAKEKEKARKSA
jgi:preprotein translocase subunit YajC